MNRIFAVLAVALFAAVLSAPARADEADKASRGQALFTKYKCQTCHSVAAAGIKRTKPVSATRKHKPPDLSKIGDERGHEWIEGWLNKTEQIEGRSHPALKFRGTKDEREAIAAWLETMKSGEKGASGSAKEAKEAAKEAKEDAKDAQQAADKAKEEAKEAAEHAREAADTTGHAH